MRQTVLLLAFCIALGVSCSPSRTPPDASMPSTPPAVAPDVGPRATPAEPAAVQEPPQEPEPEPELPAPVRPAPKVEGDLLANGSFDEGGAWWTAEPAELAVVADAENVVHGSAASARIDVPVNGSSFSLSQWTTDAVAGQTYELRGLLRIDAFEGDLIVQLATASSSDTPNQRTVEFGPVSGTQGWTEFALRTTVPPDAGALGVTIVSRPETAAQGRVWLEEFSVTPAAENAPVAANLVLNGGFEEDPTADWENPKELAVSADRVRKARPGNQSLRVQVTGQVDTPVILQQWVEGFVPGARYELRGWLCTEGLPGDVYLAVVTGRTERGAKTARRTGLALNGTDWQEVGLRFDVAGDVGALAVQVCYAPDPELGQTDADTDTVGDIWVDEVSLTELDE